MTFLKTKTMALSILLFSLTLISCGKDKDSKAAPGNNSADLIGPNAVELPGTYELIENRQTRITIDSNLLVTTNLAIPNPVGNGTRLTPRFPQALRFQSKIDEYATIGTYNDGTQIFKNVELRVRLSSNARFLDVTLIIPPTQGTLSGSNNDSGWQNDNGNQNDDPNQNPGKPCECKDQKIFVYRYERTAN
jgi:hypothetical protein